MGVRHEVIYDEMSAITKRKHCNPEKLDQNRLHVFKGHFKGLLTSGIAGTNTNVRLVSVLDSACLHKHGTFLFLKTFLSSRVNENRLFLVPLILLQFSSTFGE